MLKMLSHNNNRCFKSLRSETSGFTLLELLAVVAILGILAVAAVGMFDVSTEKARVRECDNNIKTIQIAINRAAAIYELPTTSINDAQVNPYINGGLAALTCSAKKNPQSTYHVVGGIINPAHNHK